MAVKMFAKEIGALNAIVCDMAKEQTSAELKGFLNDIGTTLRALEEGTPWANKAELYIKLMKEAVQKDMRESHSPFPSPSGTTVLRGGYGSITSPHGITSLSEERIPTPSLLVRKGTYRV